MVVTLAVIDRRPLRSIPGLAAALAAALALAGCKSGPAAKASPAQSVAAATQFYPLAVGDSWTYDVGGGHLEKIEIIGRDGPWFLDDHRGRFRIEPDGVRDETHYLLRTPVAAGAKWSAVDNLVVQRFEVVSTSATAVTRAGTFKDCVVVRNEQPLEGHAHFVTEWTYAPRVGLVELRTSVVSAQGTSQDQTHLSLVAVELK